MSTIYVVYREKINNSLNNKKKNLFTKLKVVENIFIRKSSGETFSFNIQHIISLYIKLYIEKYNI